MRQLTDHITPTNALNEALTITVLDEPGQGGACHQYSITLPDWTRNPDGSAPHHVWDIAFQNGPIKEFGLNGLSQEAFLAILIDRLRGFQSGQFACADNAEALTHLGGALECLHRRTKERVARGVEGTNKL